MSFDEWYEKYEDDVADAIEGIGIAITPHEAQKVAKSMYREYLKSIEQNRIDWHGKQ